MRTTLINFVVFENSKYVKAENAINICFKTKDENDFFLYSNSRG